MSLFEPLFLLLALASVAALLTALVAALRGRLSRARSILLRLAIGMLVYFGVAAVVSLVQPRRVFQVGDAQCRDDWCLAVTKVACTPAGADELYDVTLMLSNRARRSPQRERGTVVYLLDGRGRRYDPRADGFETPLDVLIQPGESALARRRFELPADASEVGLVYTLEGGFPIGWFVIGAGGWFAEKPLVRFPR